MRWNAPRCVRDSKRSHVESWFLKLVDAEGRRALWLKATILVRRGGSAVAEAWAVAFDREGEPVAAKETVPLADARFEAEEIRVAGLTLAPGRAFGTVGRMSFDLAFTTDAAPIVPLPLRRMYTARLPSSKLVTPHPDSRFTGRYAIDGETVAVDGWRGMQGHNWGERHAELYAWAHCNAWEGEDDLVVEGVTARVRVGPVLAPPLTLVCVRHRGVAYDFRTIVRARGTIDLRRWTFAAKNAHATITGELWADTRDFAGLTYENPDGAITYCLNSKIARGRARLSVRGRPDVVATTRAAALEIGTRDSSHGVKMLV